MTQSSAKKTFPTLALLAAIAAIIRLAEVLLPLPPQLGGVKPGLANAITIFCLYVFGLRLSCYYLVIRIIIIAMFVLGFFTPAFCISTAGAVLSLFAMALGLKLKIFSPLGIGVIGAVTHNTAQLFTASLLMQSSALYSYLPFLIILSVPFGLITGYIAQSLLKRSQSFRL